MEEKQHRKLKWQTDLKFTLTDLFANMRGACKSNISTGDQKKSDSGV